MAKFIYFRCSSEHQDNERQLYAINQYLDSRNESIEDYQVFSDEGISGGVAIAERQTKQILKQLKKDDLILVVEMSRMSRNFADRVGFISYCDKIGAKIYNISKQRFVTLDTSDGGIVDIIDSWQDDSFLRNLRKATRQGVAKAKAEGKKFGKANANYTVDDKKQLAGRLQAAKTRTGKSLSNAEFQSFCRILKRVFPILEEHSTDEPLFMLGWSELRDEILRQIDNEKLSKVFELMKEANLNNHELFANYLNKSLLHIRAKIGNSFGIIQRYILNNN